MHLEGENNVNDAYGKSAYNIMVEIESGVGGINLEVP